MKHICSVTSLIVAALVSVPQSILAQGVLVQARETGQGILRVRGGACYVITPFHVIESTAGPVRVVSERATQATAELIRELPGDLAILRVSDGSEMRCEEMRPEVNFAERLRGQTSGTLSMREADGSQTLMPVLFDAIDDEFVHVRPARAGSQIQKSMSGSSLIVNGALAGLLLSVENGVGLVYQLDDVLRVSEGFFAPEPASRTSLSREVLASLAGDYNAGSVMLRVVLREDGVLLWGMSTAPLAELEHDRDLRFAVKGIPDVSVEFRRNAAGEVTECVTYQANGKPVGIRQSRESPSHEFLASLVGEYVNGPMTILVGWARNGNLTFAVKGNPAVELLHARDAFFMVRGVTGTYIEFSRAPNGTVLGLAIRSADSSTFVSRARN